MGFSRDEIENFLYNEANLMDEHRYDEWEALWADDGVYWVPTDNAEDPTAHVSIIYADRQEIARRIARLKTDAAWAQDPRSGLRRVVSNVQITEDGNGTITVYSNFVLTEVRRRSVESWQNIWSGRTIHKLRRENEALRIASKKVMLVNNDVEVPSLWFLV